MTYRTSVFVVDDDPSSLKGLSRLLRSAGYDVETFEKPGDFLAMAPSARGGCVVLDLRMPELSGLDVQAALRQAGCELPLVFVTGDGDVPASVRAMKGGAVDFLLKPVDETELFEAVERALAQGALAQETRVLRNAIAERFSELTPRERDVCERVARGLLNKQIAAELELSESTVKQHRAKGMEKLGVGSAAELSCFMERLRGGSC